MGSNRELTEGQDKWVAGSVDAAGLELFLAGHSNTKSQSRIQTKQQQDSGAECVCVCVFFNTAPALH